MGRYSQDRYSIFFRKIRRIVKNLIGLSRSKLNMVRKGSKNEDPPWQNGDTCNKFLHLRVLDELASPRIPTAGNEPKADVDEYYKNLKK
jgi:hypothetical protein